MTAVRIAMWSGPRNISTAMMRAFENRADCAVVDEPLYAHYLAETGDDHPMRSEVLASQPNDWRDVAAGLTGPLPAGATVHYQKHMSHHLLPGVGRGWLAELRHAFLIRDPRAMLASYRQKRATVSLEELGLPQQVELFEWVREKAGQLPPVVDSADVLRDPRGVLSALCAALGIAFDEAMLSWPPGPRASDGVWAPHWYDAVLRSSGFASYAPKEVELEAELEAIAAEAAPLYARLAAERIRPASG